MDLSENKAVRLLKEKSVCSICEHQSSKTFLYVCESGHVMCENCHINRPQHECENDTKCWRKKFVSNHRCTKTNKKGEDLSSGDCKYTKKTVTPQERADFKDNEIKMNDIKGTAEATVEYMNEKYKDVSSSDNLTNLLLKQQVKEEDEIVVNSPRPLVCPVCSMMIATNSVMMHFYFDHSKVPRLILSVLAPQHIVANVTDFTFNTKCFAIFLLDQNLSIVIDHCNELKSKHIKNFSYTNQSMLLMGAKVSTSKATTVKVQKEYVKENEIIKKHEENSSKVQWFGENDNILIWISKIAEHEVIYDIQIAGEGRKLSFGFTGGAMHMRDKQDVHSMYHNAACLTLRGKAANRLIDSNNQIHVFVRLF